MKLFEKEQILRKKKHKLNRIPGIYFLIRGQEIVYVGKSSEDCTSRIQHHINSDKKKFDSFVILPVSEISEIGKFESEYIFKFSPVYNKQLSSIPDGVKLVGGIKSKKSLSKDDVELSFIGNKIYCRLKK